MNILLIADTHGRIHPSILSLAARAQHVVHAGDIGHPDIVTALQNQAVALTVVRGNNDTPEKWPASAHADLLALGSCEHLSLPQGLLVVEHGDRVNPAAKRHVLLRRRYPQARLIVYGHSHRLVIDESQTPWVVNPGAAGRNRTCGGSTCLTLNITGQRWTVRAHRFDLSDWRS